MFKILIAGKTIDELKEKIAEFAYALEGGSVAPPPVWPEPEQPELPIQPPPIPPFEALADEEFDDEEPVASKPSDQFDSKGMPWDERIHSATGAKTKYGNWRLRRGVEPEVIEKVEAELKAKMQPVALGVPAEKISSPTIAAPPAAPLQVVPPPAPVEPPAPVAPPPLPPPQPTVTLVHTYHTFKTNLVATLAELVKQGKINADYIQAVKTYFKVDEIWKANELQLKEFFEQLVAGGLLQKADQ